MKKFIYNLSVVALTLMSTCVFASCEDEPKVVVNHDDDKREHVEDILIVTPTDLSMGGSKDETASFEIKSDTIWSISGDADWLSVSSRNGNGDTRINLKTLRANESAASRSVTLTVMGKKSSQSITVTQMAGAKPLYVELTNEVIMSDGYFADLKFVGNVKGFHYACYYADNVSSWTDEDFKRELKNKRSFSPEEYNYADYVLPYANTNYVYVAVAYNDQKEYGPVVKHEFTSKSSSTSYDAFVSNFKMESTRWTFDIQRNVHCERYYYCYLIDSYEDNVATLAAYYLYNNAISSAFFAGLIDEGIKQQTMESTTKEGSLQISRRSDQSAILFWTWGQSAQRVFSGNIQWDYCSSSSSARVTQRRAPQVDANGAIELNAEKPTIQEVQMLKRNIKVASF